MKNRSKIFTVSAIALACLFVIGSYIFSKTYHENIKRQKKMYCYETFRGPSNSAFVIKDLKFKDELITYYRLVEKGENPTFSFPLITLPTDDPVYLVNVQPDSLITEIVSYYDRGVKFGGSYLRGYVYTKTLHEKPPAKKSMYNR